jgi:flagella basal body P-ring formation protein FlgA
MIVRVLVAVCWLARFAPAQTPACSPVEEGRIVGKDLAGVVSAFQALPSGLVLGPMPLAGSKRIFHIAELAALAQRYSIALDSPQDVCFEWPMESLDSTRVLDAMRASLTAPSVQIEITETTLAKVPRGRLEFPLEMLGKPATAAQIDPVLWRGFVVYGGNLRFAVWAKVRVKAPCERAVAMEALKAGQLIELRHFRVETAECFPSHDNSGLPPSVSPAGMIATRAISAGAEIRPEVIAPPNDVNRGDSVHVEVRSGAAHLEFTAKAETAGRSGDVIAVRNPSSNKIFRARIAGKGQVLVEPDFPGPGSN